MKNMTHPQNPAAGQQQGAVPPASSFFSKLPVIGIVALLVLQAHWVYTALSSPETEMLPAEYKYTQAAVSNETAMSAIQQNWGDMDAVLVEQILLRGQVPVLAPPSSPVLTDTLLKYKALGLCTDEEAPCYFDKDLGALAVPDSDSQVDTEEAGLSVACQLGLPDCKVQ